MAVIGRQRVGQLGVSLIVNDVAAAADFYRDVLGAVEIERRRALSPGEAPSTTVYSVDMRLGDAFLMVQLENPRWREAPRPDWPRSPRSTGAPSACFSLYVDDVDQVYARALAAGANPQTPAGPEDGYRGDRVMHFYDPFGHIWRILTRQEDVATEDLPARFEAARAAWRAKRAASA